MVIGARALGRAMARTLKDAGRTVHVVSRLAIAPGLPGITPMAADMMTKDGAVAACAGATTTYQCASLGYHRWPQNFPTLQANILAAAQGAGAVPVVGNNLYDYGVAGTLSEDLPLSARTRKGAVQAWYVPSPLAVTIRALLARTTNCAGLPEPRIKTTPAIMLCAVDLFVPAEGEIVEMGCSCDVPFVVDHAKWDAAFGIKATDLDSAMQATIDWCRAQRAQAGARHTTRFAQGRTTSSKVAKPHVWLAHRHVLIRTLPMSSIDLSPIRDLPVRSNLLLGSALGWATLFSLALIPTTLALLVLDPRVLDAELLWLKPLKFQISMAVMCGTLALTMVADGPALTNSPWLRVPALLVAVTAVYGLTLLGIRAARGVRSVPTTGRWWVRPQARE